MVHISEDFIGFYFNVDVHDAHEINVFHYDVNDGYNFSDVNDHDADFKSDLRDNNGFHVANDDFHDDDAHVNKLLI